MDAMVDLPPAVEGMERLARQQQALAEAARIAVASPAPGQGLQALLDLALEALPAATAGLVLVWDPAAGLLRPGAAIGYDLRRLHRLGLQLGEGLAGRVQERGEGVWAGTPAEAAAAWADLRAPNRVVLAEAGGDPAAALGVLAAPLRAGADGEGVLLLEARRPGLTFSAADLAWAQILADLAAGILRLAHLAERAEAGPAGRASERLRAELLAILSHELRMPLTAIKGYASALLLKEAAWSEAKSAEFLHLIEAECDNLEVLLREILDSAVESVDQLRMTPETVQLAGLARHLADEIQRATKRHHLMVDFPADFPAIECDPRWTAQVFRNLLDNAVKYSPEGGLIVLRGVVRPHSVVVSISDQGIGIAAEDLIPLFEKYFRVKAPAGHTVPGAGLGLPIARAVVEAHGGRIWVESRLGEGTTVFFSLPRPAAAGQGGQP